MNDREEVARVKTAVWARRMGVRVVDFERANKARRKEVFMEWYWLVMIILVAAAFFAINFQYEAQVANCFEMLKNWPYTVVLEVCG